MLNNNQEVNTIDERILPTTGLITLTKFMKFAGINLQTTGDIERAVAECEKNNISIFKTSVNNWTWLVCLDDFKKMRDLSRQMKDK